MNMKRGVSVALVALLALAADVVQADRANEASGSGKITPSPALAEAIANGEVSDATDFTAKPVEVNASVFDAGSGDAASSSASAAPSTAPTPTSAAPATSTPPSSGGETAVDTFQSAKGISSSSSGKMGTGSMILIACAAVGSVGAIMVAVMFKRQAVNTQDDDEQQQQQEQQRRTTTCMFENADYTPGKPSMDGMLQDDRMTTGSSTMMPVFSLEDRMDMSSEIVRLSSPFGAKGVRISSPRGGGGASTTVNMEFSVDPNSQRWGSGLSFSARSTDAFTTYSASTDTVVHIKPATTSAEL